MKVISTKKYYELKDYIRKYDVLNDKKCELESKNIDLERENNLLNNKIEDLRNQCIVLSNEINAFKEQNDMATVYQEYLYGKKDK